MSRANAAQCHSCNWVAMSCHRHDFRSCLCGDVTVDGGGDYNRRLWADGADWTELTTVDECRAAVAERREILGW